MYIDVPTHTHPPTHTHTLDLCMHVQLGCIACVPTHVYLNSLYVQRASTVRPDHTGHRSSRTSLGYTSCTVWGPKLTMWKPNGTPTENCFQGKMYEHVLELVDVFGTFWSFYVNYVKFRFQEYWTKRWFESSHKKATKSQWVTYIHSGNIIETRT